MKPELEKLCREYADNRGAVEKAFRWDNSALYAVCANIFCACGKTADTERLKECRKMIRAYTGVFSKFRKSTVRSILASMLSLEERPEERMAQANEYYRMLKRQFRGSEYLVLTAFLLADLTDRTLTEETVSRGKEIYSRMNRQHRVLTDKMDSVFAMLMALSGKTTDELAEETEIGYRALKKKFSNGGSQTSAQVLSTAEGAPEEKAQRVIDLYDALGEAGIKYGRSGKTASLAALSLADTPLSTLAEEIKEVDEFLKNGGAGRFKENEQAQRAMYAAMIVSDQYAGTDEVNITVITNTTDMLLSKQRASRFSLIMNLLQFAAKLIPEPKETPETEQATEKQTEEKQAEQNGQ